MSFYSTLKIFSRIYDDCRGGILFALPGLCFFLFLSVSLGDEILTVAGAAALAPPVTAAAKVLQMQNGLEIQFKTSGGSSAGIAALGGGGAQVAMLARSITPEDRAAWPECNFNPIYLGEQVVSVGVALDVWEGGVHWISKEQLIRIYEGKLKNWKELGGPDDPIVFFNASEGRGVWEIMIQWLYGDSSRVPLARFQTMKSDEDARNSIEFTRGSIAWMSPKMIDGRSVVALAVDDGSGHAYPPAIANLVSQKYPLMKPMYLVVNDRPTGAVKTLVNFMLAPEGSVLMEKYGYFSVAELKGAAADFQAP